MVINRRYRTAVAGVTFPAFASQKGSALLAALWQLEQSQWQSSESILSMQHSQLLALMNFAVQSVPYYQKSLPLTGFHPGMQWDEDWWSSLPVLTRQHVQENSELLMSGALPEGHGPVTSMQSSGSTGRPVKVKGSGLTKFYWDVMTLRDNHWQQHDFMQKFAAVRPDRAAKGNDRILCKTWGSPVDDIYQSVPTLVINSRVDVLQQLQWVQEYQPVYLLGLPSALREMLRLSEQENIQLPSLQQVRCFGETVSAHFRDTVSATWGVTVADMYSSQEIGYMALQCPDFEHYHIQSETMYVEILDESNQPCAPGEIGRVVVTPLHNFAMPLLRYEVGDYAEVGEPCPCGRGLPVLKRIVGRTRNMVRTPEGKCYWPSFPVEDFLRVADIRQFQLRQTSIDSIEVALSMAGELSAEQETQLVSQLHASLNYPFTIKFRQVDSITVQENGKYEDFISML